MGKSPIFIVGPPRSGTTLTAEILNQHSDIHISIETHYFEEVYPMYKDKKDPDPDSIVNKILTTNHKHLSDKQREKYKLDEVSGKALEEEVSRVGIEQPKPLTAYLKHEAKRRNKKLFGEKTPRHVFHLETIKKFYPNAPVILVARDGRDFLASYKAKHGPDRDNDQLPLYDPIVTSYMWRKAITKLLHHRDSNNTYTLFYEKLVRTPELEIKNLCNFLEVDFQDSMMKPGTDNSSYDRPSEENGFNTDSIGNWRQELTTEELYFFDKIAGGLNRQLNYESSPDNPNLLTLTSHLIKSPVNLTRAIILNHTNMASLLRYLQKRI